MGSKLVLYLCLNGVDLALAEVRKHSGELSNAWDFPLDHHRTARAVPLTQSHSGSVWGRTAFEALPALSRACNGHLTQEAEASVALRSQAEPGNEFIPRIRVGITNTR
jgi:hypothetical protein